VTKPYITSELDRPALPIPGNDGTYRVTIDRSIGCQNLEQRVFRFAPGSADEAVNQGSEEIFYVVSGQGRAVVDDKVQPLAAGTGLLVPADTPYFIETDSQEELVLLSILSPQPGQTAREQADAWPRADGKLTTSEDKEEALSAGDDRVFKLLIDPRYGCRNLTQFVGTIYKSKAPDHIHTYEEVIYILDGEGLVHIDGKSHEIKNRACLYLPPGVPHCLENVGENPLRLLGVFCPAGSPANKKEGEPTA